MATSSTNKEERQVLGFKTVKGLERHVQKLQLRRIMIADLDMTSDIEGGYIGGRVVATHASSYSQGHTLSIFVRDKSVSDTQDESCQLLIEIDGNIAEDMPSLLSEEFMLFVSHGLIMLNEVEFSQDHDCCLQVKGPQPRVWIVHKNAEKPGFFQQQSCKAAWFQKQKKKRLELEEAETKETSPPVPSAVQDSTQDADNYSLSSNYSFPPDSAFISSADDTSTASSSSSSGSDVPWKSRQVKCGDTGRKYVYKTLSELQSEDKKINVFAIVKDFSEPTQTRGTDMYSIMWLIDESSQVGIKCLSFARSLDKFPQVRRSGDVVCLHRLYAQVYQSCLQLISNRFSSSLRFSGKVGGSLKAHTSSLSYTLTREDKLRVKQLRAWHLRQTRGHSIKVKDVTEGSLFGLICQLVCVSVTADCLVLTVWDGTKATLSLSARQVDKGDDSRTVQALKTVAYGFTYQVAIKNTSQCTPTLKPGSILLINNVTTATIDGQVELCVKDNKLSECIDVLQPRDYARMELMETLHSVSGPTATTTPHAHAPYISIATLHQLTEVPLRAHMRVKMVAICTQSLEDMVRLKCTHCGLLEHLMPETNITAKGLSTHPCPRCPRKSFPHCSYVFQMTVTDLSGEVVILHVACQEAAKLLGKIHPTNLYRCQTPRYRLLQRLNHFSGGNNPFSPQTNQPRPWIECCVVKIKYEDAFCHVLFDTSITMDTV